jgi:hypothetical protein
MLSGVLCAINCAQCAKLSSEAIRMIVPFAVGGGTDIVARAVALKIGDAFGQSVVVDKQDRRQRQYRDGTCGEGPARRLHDHHDVERARDQSEHVQEHGLRRRE